MNRLKFLKDATAKSSIRNMLIRPFGMILAAIYTPLLLSYLGVEANGVWATVLSFITWINYCDLGIGNGLRKPLAKELANQQYEDAKKSVSTAYIVLTGISLIMLICLMLFAVTVNWNAILNTSLIVKPMMIITLTFIIINFILALSNSILYAMQLSEQVSVRSCLVQVINIIGILILRRTETGNLTHMAILFGTSTSLIYLFNTFTIIKKNKYLMPGFHAFDKKKIKSITSFGLQFFIVQLTAILIFSSHNLIASNLFGAAAVTPMNTLNSVFAAGYSIMAALVVPMWSRTTEAIAKGEFDWIRKAMRNVRLIAIVFAVGFVFVAVIFRDLSHLWLGVELDYQPGLIESTCLFYLMELLNLVFVQFYYGMDDIKKYVVICIVQAILIIPLAYWLSITMNIGIAGIKLAASILLLISGCILPILTYSRLKTLEAAFAANRQL